MKKEILCLFLGFVLLLPLRAAAYFVDYPAMTARVVADPAKNDFSYDKLIQKIDSVYKKGLGSVSIPNVSGPFDLEFRGEAEKSNATHYTWQVAQDPDFKTKIYNITAPFTLSSSDTTYISEPLRYTFDRSTEDEALTYYVRMVSSKTGDDTAEAPTDNYVVKVFASKLEAPNVFTPGTDGKNDEFRVAYRSIKKFRCWIFNRWGVEVSRFEDPSLGWDGKVNGQYCPTGVYFYVIEAEGTDGQQFKLKGDLNLFLEKTN